MNRLFLILTSCLALALGGCDRTRTSVTHEKSALHAMVGIVQDLNQENHGYYPTNWSQLEGRFNFKYFSKLDEQYPESFPIQEHYFFVSQDIPLEQVGYGKVLLIRLEAVTDNEGLVGRGGISISTNGPRYFWMREKDVQRMLEKAKVTLPESKKK